MSSIKIENLSKSYHKFNNKKYVLNKLNMEFSSEKCVFITGQNGSGKSTLIKCIMNLLSYEGNITISSNKIGYTPEKLILPDYITVKKFLYLICKIRKMPSFQAQNNIDEYIEKFKITEHQDKYLINLSKGTKQKVNLIQALLGENDIYIFDEPLSGLDDESKKVFVNEINKLRKRNKLVIISTHHLSEYKFRVKNVVEVG